MGNRAKSLFCSVLFNEFHHRTINLILTGLLGPFLSSRLQSPYFLYTFKLQFFKSVFVFLPLTSVDCGGLIGLSDVLQPANTVGSNQESPKIPSSILGVPCSSLHSSQCRKQNSSSCRLLCPFVPSLGCPQHLHR
jgi:hypothetical protein